MLGVHSRASLSPQPPSLFPFFPFSLARKKLYFGQLFLWASSFHILFARGHSLLVLVNREL